MTALVVLVCGARDYKDEAVVRTTLSRLHATVGIAKLVQGGAHGADRFARMWAERQGVPCQTHEARWVRDGKAAGPLRNQRMLDEEQPDMIVAFNGGPGTKDMVRRARKAGVQVLEVDQ